MNIPDEFKLNRQGRTMVLYAGLLNAAHDRISEIDTELQQVPSKENGQVAIVKAWVRLRNPADSTERVFGGLGDASPENVNKNIAPHIIRMAETRAKARALRDALNVHAEILEDAPESPESTRTTNQPRPGAQTATSHGQNEEEPERTPGGATVRAANYLKHLGQQEYGSIEAFQQNETGGKPIEQLSAREVKTLIEGLKNG